MAAEARSLGVRALFGRLEQDRDFGSLVAKSGARGFVAKAELSGGRLAALLEYRCSIAVWDAEQGTLVRRLDPAAFMVPATPIPAARAAGMGRGPYCFASAPGSGLRAFTPSLR